MSLIAISGASGLVGGPLVSRLRSGGHTVVPITRKQRTADTSAILWNPDSGILNPDRLSGVDTIVHLAGENIAAGRWTSALKNRLRTSRVEGTRNLIRSLAALPQRPRTFIAASAIGYYGDRGEEVLTEDSAPGSGFLADLCRDWERESQAAAGLGMRVVCVRIGVVLSPKGGALAKMLLPFKLGLGGLIGNGKQYWSWIGLEDLVRLLVFCIEHESLHGAVNGVSPHPLTNREFTRAVGRALHRPTLFPMPAFMARLALGEMAQELLLASTRVVPQKLQQAGFRFEHPELVECLTFELSQN